MSFRMKITHQLLQQPTAPETMSFSFLDNRNSSYLNSNYMSLPMSTPDSQGENRPKGDSSKGMAIRIVASAEADHM